MITHLNVCVSVHVCVCMCVALIMQRRAAVINVDETDGGSLLKHSDLSPQLHTVYDQPP